MGKCIKEVMLGNYAREVARHLALIEKYKGDVEFVDTVISAMVGIIGFMADCGFITERRAIEHTSRFIDKANEIANV